MLASLSLDLDNEWTYLKAHGDPQWERHPTYLPLVVPRVLRFLAERDLRITFFVVGQDAEREENREPLASIAAAGHEVANHSFSHEPWLHLYSEDEVRADLRKAAEAIEEVTGRRPVGFRGPGYSLSLAVLRALAEQGYEYDASTLPTFLGPLARAYYFFKSGLSREERRRRRRLFGLFRDGLRPLKPYRWRLGDDRGLIEIPVTTAPLLRTPIHLSYLLYLRRLGPLPPRLYLWLALRLLKLAKLQPSLLLHPLDFLGREDVSSLDFFPAMDLARSIKLDLVDRVLRVLTGSYELVSMERHAAFVAQSPATPNRSPDFR